MADSIFAQLHDLIIKKLWGTDLKVYGWFKAYLIKFLRILYLSLSEFSEEQISLRAESLTYTTLLSIVPLLAFAFSVLKAFGVYRLMGPVLNHLFAPLGPQGEVATRRIIEFVGRIKVGVLGSIGLATLIFTLLSVISKVENAFNDIWKVKRPRTTIRQITDYISVLVLGPILIFTAFAITAAAMNTSITQNILTMQPLGYLIYIIGKLIPYIMVTSAFTFIYAFIPNVKVNLLSAVRGGVFAGTIWQITGWAFAAFVASSGQYTAIYSSFAIVVLFMIWIYTSWVIALIGAEISVHHQFFRASADMNERIALSIRSKERLALLIMYMVSYNFCHNKPPWNLYTFMDRLGLPIGHIQDMLMILGKKNLLLKSGESREETVSYLPARDIGTITIADIIQSVRTVEEDAYATSGQPPLSVPELNQIMETIDRSLASALENKTIKDIILSSKVEI